jgi:hypothetical protein
MNIAEIKRMLVVVRRLRMPSVNMEYEYVPIRKAKVNIICSYREDA